MSTAGNGHPVDRVWFAFSSTRTTAVLTIALTLVAGIAAVVPQGADAMRLVQFDHAEDLRRLAIWGFTDVFQSAWIRALGVLLVANVLAVVLRSLQRRPPEGGALDLPARAPHTAQMTASFPERAVEALRTNLRSVLGTAPTAEKVDGPKVTMVFDTNPRSDLAPLVAHVGLILLVVGAGLVVQPPARDKAVVRALMRVTDSRSGYTGTFDMAQGEPRQFFQWRAEYVIRDYVASRNGLGPAIRMERIFPEDGRRTDFWVYQDAPPGFDREHRRGFVSIEPVRVGLEPAPGYGVASNWASMLLLFGLSLTVLGAIGASRAAGRLWVRAEGDRVEIAGVPKRGGDAGFARSFDRLALLARWAVERG